MLTERERAGAKDLMSLFSPADLVSLVRTVTRNQIAVSSKDEAVRAIVNYTERAVELLRRRRVKRDILFQYLTKEGERVNARLDKIGLIRAVLEFWGSDPVDDCDLMEVEYGEERAALPPRDDRRFLGNTPKASPTAIVTNQAPPAASANVQRGPSNTTTPIDTSAHTLEMAKQFASWFYQMLNSYHPFSQEAPVENFGPQHFYPDCTLKILCVTPDKCTEEVQGSETVTQRMLAFVKNERLKFNPNVDPAGVKGHVDQFGLTNVMVCGTVHSSGQPIGIFQQQFGLIRDPEMHNNWRVKFTNLKLAAEKSTSMPTLADTEHLLAVGY